MRSVLRRLERDLRTPFHGQDRYRVVAANVEDSFGEPSGFEQRVSIELRRRR